MSSVTATRNLRDEHRLILQVVGVLERILDAANGADGVEAREPAPDAAEGPDLESLEACVEFFRLFTDACHHGKEEGILFPELVGYGMPREGGPIAVMLHEHEVGRGLVRRMARAIERARQGDAIAPAELDAAGRDYVALIRGHIWKEDDVLFELADGLVTGPACQRICGRYHEVCGRRFEGRSHADLESLAERLLEAYPPTTS